MRRAIKWDLAFALYVRAWIGGPIGGALMICYAMINQHNAHKSILVPLEAIGGAALGDKAVENVAFQNQAVILGIAIHAINSVIFAFVAAVLCAIVLSLWKVNWRFHAPLSIILCVAYAISLMNFMQRVVVPLTDPVFAEYTASQVQFTIEHIIYGLTVGLSFASIWASRWFSTNSG